MLKRQIMKKVFDIEFNVDRMRSQILLKNERKDKKKMNKIYKLAIPICLVVCGIFLFSQNNFILKSNNTIKNSVHINKLKNLSQGEMIFEVDEVEIHNIPKKFDFIFNVNIPKSFKLERKYNLYTRSNIEVNTFDILRDYVFEYQNENGNKIIISFSEIGNPLKDYHVTGGVSSKVNNTDLLISQYQEIYIITFNYKNIYFAIEAEGISIEQLTSLLESLIQ